MDGKCAGDSSVFQSSHHYAHGPGDEQDELLGFELGVDEYISKPFSPKILVARVEAILRRSSRAGQEKALEAGGVCVNKAAHQVTLDGKTLELSYKEFELLAYFVENEGIALSREDLKLRLELRLFRRRQNHRHPCEKTAQQDGKKGEYIKTVWGMGYKFEVEK